MNFFWKRNFLFIVWFEENQQEKNLRGKMQGKFVLLLALRKIQIWVGQIGQCQNLDKKLITNIRFLSGRTIRTRLNLGQNRVRTIEM